ncbi:hypothetical protein CSC62_14000 [Pseudoxanthomonas jiangsuensis]|uniref:hypothetical protein n=1 Tax=Pseudoxanthomonas jiangsuensis TaxID=619688 RepID=UPI001392069B|nr:hypothetical protein [Pseudoxanthomonas jiangsuensis]KAF1692743.1 hypothetical protein CSC62_14000 [Pseudoxanthomonas jiangsuensis]
MKTWVIVAVTAIVGGVALLGAWKGGDWWEIRQAKKIATEQLIDPSSAQFRNMLVGDGVVCGEVNGKNRFGAYVGFKPFLVSQGQHLRFAPDEDAHPFDKASWLGGFLNCRGIRRDQ